MPSLVACLLEACWLVLLPVVLSLMVVVGVVLPNWRFLLRRMVNVLALTDELELPVP